MIEPGPMSIKLFADGADISTMAELAKDPSIKGFTTNPTLMRKSGVSDYESFARDVLDVIADHPVSFEVFSDEFDEMERQAHRIASWADNVYVKVPVTNTRGESSAKLIRRLCDDGVKVNVTAVMSLSQVRRIADTLDDSNGAIVSVFAGRIADSGRDPVPIMAAALELLSLNPSLELLWASPREVLNIVQADAVGCHIITVTIDLLEKMSCLGRSLDRFSLDTVKMFRRDAAAAGFSL
jgi:transaldolase